jgi:hypothetical protein
MTLDKREHVIKRTRERARERESVNVPTGSVPTELSRLIEEALRCLEGTDFHGASVALQKACAEAASSCDADGLPSYFGAYDGQEQGGTKHERGQRVGSKGMGLLR